MEFCKVFNPDLQQEVADNLDRAMFGKAPMLCTIDATYGEGSATQWIVPQLYNLCVTVGVKVKLDDTQLAELAQMDYCGVAYEVMRLLLTDYTEEELKKCIRSAYDSKFDTPQIAPLRKSGDAW